MSERPEKIVRILVGLFIIAIATIKAVEPHNYPSGDARNDPVLWIILGLVIGGIGIGIVASAFRPRVR